MADPLAPLDAGIPEAVATAPERGPPQGERDQDPGRDGVAVVIEIDRVQGFGQDGPFLQERV